MRWLGRCLAGSSRFGSHARHAVWRSQRMTATAAIVASHLDDDPGWCPKHKGGMLCSRDWGHYGKCKFSRPPTEVAHPRCSFHKHEDVVLKLGSRQHTQQWTFTCILDEDHRTNHAFNPIPDGHSHVVHVPRSHWRRMRAEQRRIRE